MNLNAKTVTVLKNFSQINPDIVIKEGSTLSTMSINKTIVARANVSDNFPRRAALHLNKFINSVTSYEQPIISFEDNNVLISGSNSGEKSKLTYVNEDTIKQPPEKAINLPSIDATCRITADAMKSVERQLGILGLPEIAVVGDSEKIYLQAVDSKNPTSDVFSIEIGSSDKKFRAIFKSENMKIISGDYDVDICSRGISHFRGAEVEYWIAVEQHSTF